MPYTAIVFSQDPRLFDAPDTAPADWSELFAALTARDIELYSLAATPPFEILRPAPEHVWRRLPEKDTLFCGLGTADAAFARTRGWDFALALWGGETELCAARNVFEPRDLLTFVAEHNVTDPWLGWAMELQSLAQCGLAYTENTFDKERFERVRAIAAEILSYQTDLPQRRVRELFCNEVGYQTPKIDTRAAIIRDGKILLVQERNGLWALPGGWVDFDASVRSNTEKEAREEAGAEVIARRIVAIQDRRKNNPSPSAYGIIKIFVLCELLSFEFKPNLETLRADFFAPGALPELAASKTTRAQIEMCFRAHADPRWRVIFD